MKLLIASHACALPMNQQMFALAAAERGWQVTMVIPDPWLNEYGKRMPAQLLDGSKPNLSVYQLVKTVASHFISIAPILSKSLSSKNQTSSTHTTKPMPFRRCSGV